MIHFDNMNDGAAEGSWRRTIHSEWRMACTCSSTRKRTPPICSCSEPRLGSSALRPSRRSWRVTMMGWRACASWWMWEEAPACCCRTSCRNTRTSTASTSTFPRSWPRTPTFPVSALIYYTVKRSKLDKKKDGNETAEEANPNRRHNPLSEIWESVMIVGHKTRGEGGGSTGAGLVSSFQFLRVRQCKVFFW